MVHHTAHYRSHKRKLSEWKLQRFTSLVAVRCMWIQFTFFNMDLNDMRWSLWHLCLAVSDAVNIRLKSGILDQTGAGPDVLESDTMDHYRTFQMIERLLHYPLKLVQQLLFQIPPYKQSMLIERYYYSTVMSFTSMHRTPLALGLWSKQSSSHCYY